MSGVLLGPGIEAVVEDPILEISMDVPTTDVLVLPVVGPRGPSGATVFEPVEYQMPVAQTTAVIDHDLEHDPVAVQVVVDGVQASEFEVVFTIPNRQVRVSFDVPVEALIRLF